MARQVIAFLDKHRQAAWASRMVIAWFALFSVNALCSAILAGLTGKYWSQVDPQDRFLIIIAITMNWTGTIQAFLFSAVKNMQQGKSILQGGPGDDSTTMITKEPTKP